MARKIIIDCDPGIDDAVALCIALFDPRLDVLAITATAGSRFISPNRPVPSRLSAKIAERDMDSYRYGHCYHRVVFSTNPTNFFLSKIL